MGKKPKLNVNKDEFIEMYQNHSQDEVASHFDICLASVHKLRKRFGLPMKRQLFRTVDKKEFRRLYTEGVPIIGIANRLNIDESYVHVVRNKLGLPYRYKAWEKDAENRQQEGDRIEQSRH
jgi:hypothetical protein